MDPNVAKEVLQWVALPAACGLVGYRLGFRRGAVWIWEEIQGQQVLAVLRSVRRVDPTGPDGTMTSGEK